MYESQMILTRGFQNVYENGQPIGFQILLKTAYYRGVFLDIIGAMEITVDGTRYSGDQLRLTVDGRTFTIEEAGRTENVHWDFGTAMIVTALAPGGLKPGIHEVTVTQGVNPSYVPPNLFRATGHKRMTLAM
jgi:Domain of unknown function (DUF6379)